MKNFFGKKGFYAAIYSFAGIMIVLAVVFSSVKKSDTIEPEENNNIMSNENQTEILGNSALYLDEEFINDVGKENSPVNASSDKKISEPQTLAKATKDEIKKETSTQATTQTSAQQSTKESIAQFSLFDDTKEMSWPVNGKIVMDYSMETAIYDKTLEQYRTNDSICIAADVGTPICAAAEGIVEDVFNDHDKGNCVVINHGNGWTSTYGQLQADVEVGELVTEGTEIGKVAEPTGASSLLGSHVLFAVAKDNIPNDPKLLVAQLDE